MFLSRMIEPVTTRMASLKLIPELVTWQDMLVFFQFLLLFCFFVCFDLFFLVSYFLMKHQ